MVWKKNDVFQVRIEDMSENGEGIGKSEGFTWFIKDTVIGDMVEAKAMKVKKSYGFARLLQIMIPSLDRVEPACPVARQCGGCQLQAMGYEAQLRFKENKILNNLKRIGGLTEGLFEFEPIIGMDMPWRYRNKAQFPVGSGRDGRVLTGFYAGRTHVIIEHEDCLLGVAENREVLARVRGYMEQNGVAPYDEGNHRGIVRHVLVRKGFKSGELMVCLVVNGGRGDLPGLDGLVERLLEIPGMSSVSLSVNRERTNVIMGQSVVNLYGPGYITDWIGDVRYRISPLSFYQVNPVQTEKLYQMVIEYAGLTGNEVVWDLYCGIGTISLFLAKQAKAVYGVEVVPQAIEDARMNGELNGIANVEFFVGKAEVVLPEWVENGGCGVDVVVVDPPRKGCDPVCLDAIVKMGAGKVVYVSCDPATLARDLKYLAEEGYRVERVRGVDMFGATGSVETVCLLSRKAQ